MPHSIHSDPYGDAPPETYVHTPPSFQGPWAACPKCGKIGPDDDPSIPPGAHTCQVKPRVISLKNEMWDLVNELAYETTMPVPRDEPILQRNEQGYVEGYRKAQEEFLGRLTRLLLNRAGE